MARVLLGVMVIFGVVAPGARAQTPDELIDQGLALREAGDDAAAVEKFREALVLAPTPRAAAQLGLALQALGRWVAAEEVLGDAIGHPDDGWVGPRLSALRQAYQVILEHVGFLEILGGVVGATITIDGQPSPTLPWDEPATVTVGRHWVEIAADGYYPVQRRVTIEPGDTTRESVLLNVRQQAPEEPPRSNGDPTRASSGDVAQEPPSVETRSGSGLHPAIGLGALGVTLGLFGVTVWSGMQARSTADDFDAAIDEGDVTTATLLLNTGEDEETRSNILGVVTGAVGVATVLLLVFTDWGSEEDELRVTIGGGFGGALGALEGTF